MQKYTKKIIKNVAIIFICFILFMMYLVWIRYSNEATLRRKGYIGCLISNPKCFYLDITKEEFIYRMNRLKISKKEAVQKLIETKKKHSEKCAGNEAIKISCNQGFEYFNKVFKYLSEIPD